MRLFNGDNNKIMKKLELKHLAAYLPYGLKCEVKDQGIITHATLNGLYENGSCVFYDLVESEKGFKSVKPILIPLTDLYNKNGFSVSKMITHGYHNTFWSKEKFSVRHVYYHDLLILLERHFDVFGLIDGGLAINKNNID